MTADTSRSFFAVCIVLVGLVVFSLCAGPHVTKAQQTGSVSSSKSSIQQKGIELSFQRAGVVSAVYVRNGSKVRKGQILVQLDSSEAAGLLSQASAELDMQKAKLDQVRTTSAASSSASVRARNASDALLDIRRSIVSTLQDGYIKADDAVRNRADQLFSSSRSAYPQIILPGIDLTTQDRLAQQRVLLEALLLQWKASLDGLTIGSDLSVALDAGINYLSATRDFLNTLAPKLNNTTPDGINSALTLRNWRSDMYTARVNVSTSIKDLLAIRTKEREAENVLALQKITAAERSSQNGIALQSALVNQAEAKRKLQEARLELLTLRAPANGTIVSVEARVGATVNAAKPAVHFLRAPSLKTGAKK